MLFNKQLGNDLECKSHLIFHNSALSQYCTEDEKSLIVKNLIHRSYHRNEVVFYEGQPSFLIYFICSGVVKLWKRVVINWSNQSVFQKQVICLAFGVHLRIQIIHFQRQLFQIQNYTLSRRIFFFPLCRPIHL